MSNPYRASKAQEYQGEYFMAAHNEDHDYAYTIWQINPRVWVAVTSDRETAIELVNRLDRTGEYNFGEDE